MGLFDFYDMQNTYEQRKVANYEGDGFTIDTCEVTDGLRQYETAIKHPAYTNDWIVLEAYHSKECAQKGHDEWVKKFTTGKLPKAITEFANAEVAQLCDQVNGGPRVYKLRTTD